MRIFIAVELPAAIKAEVAAYQAALRMSQASIRWTRPESLHLTLKFLGEIGDDRLPAIFDAVQRVAERYRAMSISLTGVGVFPHLHNPRILWVGVGGEAEELAALAEGIDIGLSALGFPREERSYKPHLTIGRFNSPLGATELMTLARQVPPPILTFKASGVTVLRSVLNPRAAVYSPLFKSPLSRVSV